MIDLSKCKSGDILICKHGVIKEYVRPITKEEDTIADLYDCIIKYLYKPFESFSSIEYRKQIDGFKQVNGSLCNDGFVFRKNRLETDTDVIKVIDRQVFKRYLKMLSNKL